MTYDEQYDIATGIFMMFDKNKTKKMLSVRHGRKVRDEMKQIFPHKQYESYTKSVMVLASLYVNFYKMPSSAIQSYEELGNIDMKTVRIFKDEIIQYRKYLNDDITLLKSDLGTNISLEDITDYYRRGLIKWYTWYFYLVVSDVDLAKLSRSRINGLLYRKIRTLMVFVSFSQDSMLLVRELMTENLSFN